MSEKLVDKYNFPFHLHLCYDETSPSCLRWKVDKWSGIHDKILVAAKDSIAGTHNKQWNRYQISIDGIKYQVAAIVCKLNKLTCSELIGKLIVEHKDKDSTNNLISNLRITTQKINMRNSGKRVTNTSGKTGVHRSVKCGTIYFVASYTDLDGRLKSKWFSTKKLSYEKAFTAACAYRDDAINRMNSVGAGYTEDHF